jgi:chaperonin GroEL
MAKILKFDAEAKSKLLDGITKLAKAVSTTLGPCGRNVIIDEYG